MRICRSCSKRPQIASTQCFVALLFDLENLADSASKIFALNEPSIQKRIDKFECQLLTDDSTAHAEHVHIVVLNALMRRVSVVADAGPDARDLVRSNANTDATATDQDPSIGTTLDDLFADGGGKVWEIAAGIAMGTAVDQRLHGWRESFGNQRLDRKAGVIAADGDAKGIVGHGTSLKRGKGQQPLLDTVRGRLCPLGISRVRGTSFVNVRRDRC